MVRAECEEIASTSASSNTGRIIICIGVSPWTCRLEDPWVSCRLARLWTSKAPCATVPWWVESRASTFAGHHLAIVMRPNLKSNRAHHIEITNASSIGTFSRAFIRRHRNSQVIAINKAHIIEILFSPQRNLSKSRWRCATNAITKKGTTTVTSGAFSTAMSIKSTTMSSPYAARPCWWKPQSVSFFRKEFESTSRQDWLACTRLNSRPHRVAALVVHGNWCGWNVERKEGEEKEKEERSEEQHWFHVCWRWERSRFLI